MLVIYEGDVILLLSLRSSLPSLLVQSHLAEFVCLWVVSNDSRPHAEAVEVLPSVYLLERLLRLLRYGCSKVKGKLTDVNERVLVGGVDVEGVQFDQAVTHEHDRREGGLVGELARLGIALVGALKAVLNEGEGLG